MLSVQVCSPTQRQSLRLCGEYHQIPSYVLFTVRTSRTDVLQVVVDGVCSVGSEEIHFDDWGLDVILTASQKGLSTPPGLSIVLASPRAIKVCLRRLSGIPIHFRITPTIPTGLPGPHAPTSILLRQLEEVTILSYITLGLTADRSRSGGCRS